MEPPPPPSIYLTINKLLQADNEIIKEGTRELADALKRPGVIGELCQVVGGQFPAASRQYAAVLLRQRLGKSRHWGKLDQSTRQSVKAGLLEITRRETESSVCNAVIQLVGVLARHELPAQQWPELLSAVVQLGQSDALAERQLSLLMLSTVSGEAADELSSSLTLLLPLVEATLRDSACPPSSLGHAFTTLTHLAPMVGDDHMASYQKLLPDVLSASKRLLGQDQEQAALAFDLFDVLAECEVSLLVPQLRQLIQLCIEVAANKQLDTPLRVKAAAFLGYITRLKKKYLVKQKMVGSVVGLLFELLCEEGTNDYCIGFLAGDGAEGADSLAQGAAQALDSCALNLPPEKLLAALVPLVDQALKSDNPHRIKGAYLSLAMVAEGCSDTLRTKHLHQLLQCICRGITSDNQVVRNGALFALGQFAEHLQPDISKYHTELLPVLFQYLSQTCSLVSSGGSEPPGVDRMFYALEVFCEHLEEEELVPHLPPLVDHLLAILAAEAASAHMKELAISAIGATASSVKGHMAPHFERIVELLKGYLTKSDDDTLSLQVQALDTLGQLTRSLGREHFLKYALECTTLGLGLLEHADDPDLRKTCYLLFASLSSVLNADFTCQLPKIMDYMLVSLQSKEGIVTHLKDDAGGISGTLDCLTHSSSEEEEEDNVDDEDRDVAGYSVENAYLEEKEDTCVALRELALHCGDGFVPYIEGCGKEVYKLINYPSEAVRQAAIGAITQFTLTLAQSSLPQANEAFQQLVQVLVAKVSEIVHTDECYSVVMAGLESCAELLKVAGPRLLQHQGHLDALLNCITSVMNKKTVCQDMADEADSDDEEAEQDELLVEYAGEVVAPLGAALGPAEFAQHFPNILPLFCSRMKRGSSDAERSFAMGTLAECVEALEASTSMFLPQLLPLFQQGAHDQHQEVRANAIYGLGLLVQHGGDNVVPHIHSIMGILSDVLSREDAPRAADNICGAVARLITAAPTHVPVPDVLPVLLRCLPLRLDYEENLTVFGAFLSLYNTKEPTLLGQLPAVLTLAASIYSTKQANEKTNAVIEQLVQKVNTDSPEQLTALAASVEPECLSRLQRAAAAASTTGPASTDVT